MNCEFQNIETKESLLNIMRYASYSNRCALCIENNNYIIRYS